MPIAVRLFLCRSVAFRIIAAACATAGLLTATCAASTVTYNDVGRSSIGTLLKVSAILTTSGSSLTIALRSYGAPTVAKADVLSSFYFNLADPITGLRPTLTYVSGTGQAYEVHSGANNDTPVAWSPQMWSTTGDSAKLASNLQAVKKFDEGWQFKVLNPPPGYPGLGFGIGTVANPDIASFIPGMEGSFDAKVVRGSEDGSAINLGIYSPGTGTDIDPRRGLDGARLVRGEAVFRFMSDTNLDTLKLQENAVFGFGTNPDSVMLPEPGTLPMLASAGLLTLGWVACRRMRCGAGA